MLGAKGSLDTRDIRDVQASNAAAVIDAHLGKVGDHEITAKDVQAARELLTRHRQAVANDAASPLAAWGVSADTLEAGLPVLEQRLAEQNATASEGGPFCSTLPTSVVRDPSTLACAHIIGKVFQQDAEHVDLHSMAEARTYWDAIKKGDLSQLDPAKVAALKAEPNFNENNITAIELFMRDGNNSLVNFGPLWIHNKEYPIVFRLPEPKPGEQQDSVRRCEDYEANRFGHTGYDRIYCKDEAGHLYVGVNDQGRVNDIDPRTPGHLGDDKNVRERIEVVSVKDVDNTLTEATLGLLSDTIAKGSDIIERKLQDRLQRGMDEVTDSIPFKDPVQREAAIQAAQRREMLSTAIGVTGLAATVATAAALPPSIPYMGVAVLGLLAFKVIRYLVAGKDARPFYEALGIPVNRTHRLKV